MASKTTNIIKRRGLLAWDANSSPGSPVCVCGDEHDDMDTFAVEIYTVGSSITGVVVTKQDLSGDDVAAAGLVPANRN